MPQSPSQGEPSSRGSRGIAHPATAKALAAAAPFVLAGGRVGFFLKRAGRSPDIAGAQGAAAIRFHRVGEAVRLSRSVTDPVAAPVSGPVVAPVSGRVSTALRPFPASLLPPGSAAVPAGF